MTTARPLTRRRVLRSVVGCAMLGLGTGCTSLLQTSSTDTVDLPPVPMPPSTVQLELLFLERPVNDPLLGRPLWSEMDQLAGIPAERRLALSENGFRLGFCGTEAPPTLASLMSDVEPDAYDTNDGLRAGRRVALRQRAGTAIKTTRMRRSWEIDLFRDGKATPAAFATATGLIRVGLDGISDGFAEIRFTPEVHYGEPIAQATPGAVGWELTTRQSVETLSEASFVLRMSLGEILVLSADDSAPERLGNQFFRFEDEGRLMQRVLVVRIGSIGREQEVAMR